MSDSKGSTFEEADLLRVAAGIQRMLSDGQWHPYRGCIELAREFSNNRREARDLAYAAMQIEAGRHYHLWAGEQGARWFASAKAVACPTCNAPAGGTCLLLNGKGPTKQLHEARLKILWDRCPPEVRSQPKRTPRTQWTTCEGSERHHMLRQAADTRLDNFSPVEVLGILLAANNTYCDPPLPDREIERIFDEAVADRTRTLEEGKVLPKSREA